jgi:hypothetical protein
VTRRRDGDLLDFALRDSHGFSSGALERMARDYLDLTDGASPCDATEPRRSRRAGIELPEPLLLELQALARDRDTSPSELVRRFVGLGLFLTRAQGSPQTSVIVRQGERERELVLL